MNFPMSSILSSSSALAIWLVATVANAAPPANSSSGGGKSAKPEPVVTRLFFQDREANTLRWADVRGGKMPTLNKASNVTGFPKLDVERQGLVQMKPAGGYVLVGIRDDDDGSVGSGWALVTTGVEEEAHGDHSHWRYKAAPGVRQAKIDVEQGNPAHLYEYDGVFYLANDKKDGYTRLDPAAVPMNGDVPTGFHQGGGAHITLAVANGAGYGTWIDREGPNAGRVDVTLIRPEGNAEIAASFTLPTGSIHGATAAGDKVFFAPANGVCWVVATGPSASTQVHHISLGTDPETEKPRRTGAFTVHRDHVLFVTGSGKDATLGLLDARAPEPSLVTVKLSGAAGTKPVTPACVRTSRGKHYAFVFHDAAAAVEDDADSDLPAETLAVIDLDPNGDADFSDASVAQTLPVGRSAIEGHSGHHAATFDADARRAYVANPGDGTITLLRLDTLEPWATFEVGGKPEAVIAVGGRASGH